MVRTRLSVADDKEEMLRQRQLALIGCVLVAFTCRLRKHLGAIEESAGRLDKRMVKANLWTEEDGRTLADALSIIKRHVNMLAEKSRYLDRFGQRTGTPVSSFDPREIVEEAMLFFSRSARVRGVSLTAQSGETLTNLSGDPLRIHFLVSILIDSMLQRASKGGEVIVAAGPVEEGALISIERRGALETMAPAAAQEGNPYWSIGQHVVADLGGRLHPTTITHDTKRASLFLPLKQAPNPSF
jgi:signal transduction histidine kinase